jgi:hypothetical protein
LISLDDGSRGIMSPCKLHAALASSLPVIYVGPVGTNVDEAIQRYACGFSLRHGDVDGLADAVRRLRDDAALGAELSRNARRAFEDAYCDERTLPLFDELFQHLREPRRLVRADGSGPGVTARGEPEEFRDEGGGLTAARGTLVRLALTCAFFRPTV